MVAVEKVHIFNEVFENLSDCGIRISRFDRYMEWGGFFVIQEASGKAFTETFFRNATTTAKATHYILILAPHQRLEWHTRETGDKFFKVIGGGVTVKVRTPGRADLTLMLSKDQSIQIAADSFAQIIATDHWTIMAECSCVFS